MAVQVPTADDLLDYLALTGSNYPIAEAQTAIDLAGQLQAERCEMLPYSEDHREAHLRRAARSLAARGALLGYTDLGSFGGPVAVQRWDAAIEEYEANWRLGGFA